jgi:hypothetical protein
MTPKTKASHPTKSQNKRLTKGEIVWRSWEKITRVSHVSVITRKFRIAARLDERTIRLAREAIHFASPDKY